MFRTRFMTGGLAAVAVASAITLASPAAHAADDRGCGQPAVPAVTQTVVVEPVFETVEAVTHTEWRWARDWDVHEFEFVRTVSPARAETDWSRVVPGPTEYLFRTTVVDSPAVPAVPGTPEQGHEETYVITPAVTVTEAEYQHQNTGELRWERDDWGSQNGNGKGWVKTGATREQVVTPAVLGTRWVVDVPAVPGTPEIPAVTHDVSVWSPVRPGVAWTGPFDERAGAGSTEEVTTDGSVPDGDGWIAGATRTFAAVTETDWAETVPDGAKPTGNHRVARTEHGETDATSAEAPFGPGWYRVDGSAVTVTDIEEQKVLLTPGSVTEVEVSPALAATEPCVEGPTGGSETEGPQAAPAPGSSVAPAAVQPDAVLPNTGGVPGWMAPAGLATMLLGAIVVRSSRRRADLI